MAANFQQRRFAVGFMVVSFVALGAAMIRSGPSVDSAEVADIQPAEIAADPVAVVVTSTTDAAPQVLGELEGSQALDQVTCAIDENLGTGQSGPAVECLQIALQAAGLLNRAPTGEFDESTALAVRDLQAERKLFVDGIVGRETAKSLGIWPDEQLRVVRTPVPAAKTLDSTGYYLSTVASKGDSAPPLPANSGSGERVVYERIGQRVWAVDSDGAIVRSWLVSGSKYDNEVAGTFEVYSKSKQTTAWNGAATLDKMVRYYRTDIGHIGFHAIPRHIEDGSVYQTEEELGTRLSGGCQRQAELDAAFLYAWAEVGTKVVVI